MHKYIYIYNIILLTGAYLVGNGWEWGLLGLLLIVIVDHSLIPY